METLEKILIALAGVITAIGGTAGIKYLNTRHEEKRFAQIKVKNDELDLLRKQYDWLNEKYEALSKKVDELYDELHKLEKENLSLVKRNAELELQLKDALHNACVRPDDDCLRRLPPRDYCRLKKLARGDYDDAYTLGAADGYLRKNATTEADGGDGADPSAGACGGGAPRVEPKEPLG